MKEKSALFVGSLSGGGAERAMLDIGRGLAERGFVVDLVLDDVPDSVRVVGLNTHGMLATLPALMNYLRRRRLSVLLSTLTTCNVAALLATIQLRRQIPVIVRQATHYSRYHANPHSSETISIGRGSAFRSAVTAISELRPKLRVSGSEEVYQIRRACR